MRREDTVVVSVTVVTDDVDKVVRVVDALSRAACGVALEGLQVSVSISRGEQELVDDDD